MTASASPPAQIEFNTPGSWVALRFPHTEADVDALIAELLSRHPELEPRRDLAVSVLRTLSQVSRVANCLYAGGGFLPLPGGPMPVTLFVNALPLEAAGTPPDLMTAAATAKSPGRRDYVTTEVELRCGKAVRAEWFQAAQLASTDAAVVSFLTQYFVLPRDTDSFLVLTFSSPAVALTRRLRKLFADIAGSLTLTSSPA